MKSRKPRERTRTAADSPRPELPGRQSATGVLDAAALGDVVDELRVIEHALTGVPTLVAEARVIANAFECDDPVRRDAIARLSLRLTGRDIDRVGPTELRMPDDDLLDDTIDAADAVIEATLWRLQRLSRVLWRVKDAAEA